jgi:hypothetical protein
MVEAPAGADLLEASRTILRETLLPALPPEHRHTVLMIANAMSIAERELRAGCAVRHDELASLRAILMFGGVHENTGSLDEQVHVLNRELSGRIRAGAFESNEEKRTRLFNHLVAVGRQRVQQSNPKYLASSHSS